MNKNPWLQEFIEQTDFIFIGLCATCSAISVYSIYSIYKTMNAVGDVKVVIVQLVASLLGVTAAILLSIIDYKELCEWYWVHMGLCILLMIVTAVIGYAPPGTTNKAWIYLPGGMSIQPSELLNISMIITIAHLWNRTKTT